MPDEPSQNPPVQPPSQPSTPGVSTPKAAPPRVPPPPPRPKQSKSDDDVDVAHVPMSEEFDRARWTLPPIGIVAIGIVIIVLAIAAVSWLGRAKPGAQGVMGDVTAVQMVDNNVLVAINFSLSNVSEKSFFIHEMKADLQTADGKTYSDSAASAVDFERYFQAFPQLKSSALDPMVPETKIPAGGSARGTIIVSFPVTKEQFDGRKSLSVVVQPYDQRAVTITK